MRSTAKISIPVNHVGIGGGGGALPVTRKSILALFETQIDVSSSCTTGRIEKFRYSLYLPVYASGEISKLTRTFLAGIHPREPQIQMSTKFSISGGKLVGGTGVFSMYWRMLGRKKFAGATTFSGLRTFSIGGVNCKVFKPPVDILTGFVINLGTREGDEAVLVIFSVNETVGRNGHPGARQALDFSTLTTATQSYRS